MQAHLLARHTDRVDRSVYENIFIKCHHFGNTFGSTFVRRSRLTCLCLVLLSVVLQCCVCRSASLGRLHSCITFHLSSLLDRVSAASSFSRAGPGAMPRSQQLMGLRKALYRALRSAFRASRRATCHMLKAYPLPEDERFPHNYLLLFRYYYDNHANSSLLITT